jgi:hypothetical protein
MAQVLVKMKKGLLITIGIIFLIGIVTAFTLTNSTISLESEKITILNSIGITDVLIGECKIIDNYTCTSNVYKKGGINKDIKIKYHYCINWSEETEELNSSCIGWETLNQIEIETKMEEGTEALLSNIADVQLNRNNSQELLTDKIQITLEGTVK